MAPMRDPRVIFSEEEKALLRRYLRSYRRLVSGDLPANTAARRQFVRVANGLEVPLQVHEIAFVKWQMWVGVRPYRPIGPDAWQGTTAGEPVLAGRAHDRMGAPPSSGSWRFLRQLVWAARRAIVRACAAAARWFHPQAACLQRAAHRAWTNAAGWSNAALGTDLALQLDRWMRDTLATGKATLYDKAMDAAHIANPSGPFHRLWDGGHSLVDAWHAVRNASATDSFGQEVTGYLTAIWKDLATPMGLPLATIDRAWFESTAATLSCLGLTKTQLADALSFTASELAGAALGVVAMLLNWSSTETARAAELAGSLGLATICAANPVLGLVAMVCFARAWQTAKAANAKPGFAWGVFKGGSVSATLIATAALVGGPVWIGIVAAIVAGILVQRAMDRAPDLVSAVDWEKLRAAVVQAIYGQSGFEDFLKPA